MHRHQRSMETPVLRFIVDVHRAGETISPKQDWGPGGRDRWFIHLTFYVSFWISLVFLYTKLQPHGPQAWACRTNNTFIPFFSSYSYILAPRKVLSHRINGHGQPNPNPRGTLRKNIDVASIAFQTFHNFFNVSIPFLSFFPLSSWNTIQRSFFPLHLRGILIPLKNRWLLSYV